MVVENHIYNDYFFDNTKNLESDSAKKFVDIILTHFNINSVIDIGCGVGIYLKEFEIAGKKILGYDGAPAAIKGSLVGNAIKLHDLTQPLTLHEKFDLCMCVEVAEHLPPESADTLINSLTPLSDLIIFTAAVPGQADRELGHINEQPHEYWIEKFQARGYTFDKELSFKLRQEMKENDIIWWIVNNLMVFKRS